MKVVEYGFSMAYKYGYILFDTLIFFRMEVERENDMHFSYIFSQIFCHASYFFRLNGSKRVTQFNFEKYKNDDKKYGPEFIYSRT